MTEATNSELNDRLKEALILIVDDLPQNLQVLGTLLRTQGFQVSPANSGEQAIKTVQHRKPDLILLDIMMPKMDGYTVSKKLREDPETADIPIIFLTARSDSDDIVEGFKAGGVDYVTKPFEQQELLARVRTHLELKFTRDLIALKNRELEATNHQLVELNEEKSNFMGMAAHDLKNPLSIISLGAELCLSSPENTSKEEFIDQMKKSLNCSQRMHRIIMNLLDVNAIEEGKMTFKIETFDLSEAVDKLIQTHEDTAKNKLIEIYCEKPAHAMVTADQHATTQILENLLSNAIKYSPPEKNIYVTLTDEKSVHQVSIRDEGPGLTEKDKEKLFGKFARLSAKPTAGESSTGLGLSIVKRLVDAMKGKVWCDSEHGKGATFSIQLPKG